MIILRSGVPGSGKTLSMVEALAKLLARFESHPEEARPIFVLGIPDLKLPHSLLPLQSVQLLKNAAPQLVPDWDALPDGALVLIDEAQGCFPPRSSASQAPDHVAALNTHRHHGFDIWLTTQHPRLIDHGVRALVGKHMHYRRMFGGSRAVVYEWDACSDSLSGLKNAVTSYWSYPKKVFDWYKSAEVHTKQSFKWPLWIWLPVIGVVMLIIFVPQAYSRMFHQEKYISPVLPKPVQSSAGTIPNPKAPIFPTVAGPAVAQVAPPVPQYVGCIANDKHCSCITSSGESVSEPDMCRESAQGFGHLVNVAMSSAPSNSPASVPSSSVLAPVAAAVAPAVDKSAVSPVALGDPSDGYGVLGHHDKLRLRPVDQ